MFTLFDFLMLVGTFTGLYVGLRGGAAHYGILGGLVGAGLGAVVGNRIGGLPWRIGRWFAMRHLNRQTTEEIRASLRSGECLMVNLAVMVLKARGENPLPELLLILDMMSSDAYDVRCRGMAALFYAFPDLAEELEGYRPDCSPGECRAKTDPLRKALLRGNNAVVG